MVVRVRFGVVADVLVFDSHLPDHSEGVSYSVFMQALNNYSRAQMRFGK